MPKLAERPKPVTGAGVKYIREVYGWSRPRLAEEMTLRGHGWDGDTVKRVEHGRKSPDHHELRDLADILGIDRDFLIDGPRLSGGGVLSSRITWFGCIAAMPAGAHDQSAALAA